MIVILLLVALASAHDGHGAGPHVQGVDAVTGDAARFLVAAEANDLPTVVAFVEKGQVFADAKNDMGDNALFAAVSNNSKEVAEYLMTLPEYEVNATDHEGASLLHVAAWHGHTELVKFLLSKNFNIEQTCNHGWTALTGAARWGELATVKLLRSHGAKIDVPDQSNKYTALMLAALNGHKAMVEYLLDEGSDPALTDGNDRTAMKLARDNGYTEVADLLQHRMGNSDL
eukprot:m.230051 g.230051  ORF g.230051 m.230051 type:complete len:229 (-) comp17899_c0_seq1:30-716(-)